MILDLQGEPNEIFYGICTEESCTFIPANTKKLVKILKSPCLNKEENKDDNENSDTESETSNQTDLSDVGLCSLNVHESKYNQALCYLMMEKFEDALNIFKTMINNGPEKYSKSMFLIRGLIYQQLGESHKSKLDFNKAFDEDHENAVRYFDEKQNVTINPFPISNRLCMNFPSVKIIIDRK